MKQFLIYFMYVIWLCCCALFTYITPIGGCSLFIIYLCVYLYEKYLSQAIEDIFEIIMTKPELLVQYLTNNQHS